MAGIARKTLVMTPLVILSCFYGSSQTAQVLPEVNTQVKLSSDLRVNFQAKATKKAAIPSKLK
jgi:hypothetical protein